MPKSRRLRKSTRRMRGGNQDESDMNPTQPIVPQTQPPETIVNKVKNAATAAAKFVKGIFGNVEQSTSTAQSGGKSRKHRKSRKHHHKTRKNRKH